jgi:catalase
MTLGNTDSVLFDAVYVPGGAASIKTLLQKGDALFFIDEAYKHAKPIAASAEGVQLLSASAIGRVLGEAVAGAGVEQGQTAVQSLTAVGRVTGLALAGAALNKYGVVTGQATDLGTFVEQVLAAIAQHRFWSRPGLDQVPA